MVAVGRGFASGFSMGAKLFVFTVSALTGSLALGQTAASAGQLEVLEVVGQQSPSPASIPIDGIFGNDKTLLEITRSASVLSADLLSQAAVVELRDLQRLIPNSYGANTFGLASLPAFRGQLGEIYQDGLKRQGGNNGLGLPLSLNGVQQIDAVKGPPPVMMGSSQRVGGFINLVSKRPDLDNQRGDISISAGRWDRYRQQLDFNQPLQPGRSAVRVSLENRDEKSYYDYSFFKSQSAFIAYRFLLDNNALLDFNLEYYNTEFTDNAGWNRPTQDLIDNGTYITGQGVQPGNGSTVPAAGSVISPSGTAKLQRSNVLVDPKDRNDATVATLNIRYEMPLSDNGSLINRTLYQQLKRDGVNQNSFVEIIDDADTLANRTELQFDYALDFFGWSSPQQSVFGADIRIHDVRGYSQFLTEADNPIDLTGPLQNRRIPLTPAQQATLVELRPGLYVSPGGYYDGDNDGIADFGVSDTTDSRTRQGGLFWQQSMDIGEHWQLQAGWRADWYDVQAKDPLPPAGFTAAADDYSDVLRARNISLSYQPVEQLTVYVAGSRSESTSNSLGGGFALNADNQVDPLNFATESELAEVGIKFASLDGLWYADIIWFDQTRSLRNRDGSNTGIKNKGVESQLNVRPADAWQINFALSYQDTRYDDSASAQGTRVVNDAFDNSRPDIIEGTGVGSPSYTVFPASDERVQGLPRWQSSLVVDYRYSDSLSGGLSLLYTDDFPLDYLQTVEIPEQYTVNAYLRYALPQWNTDIRLDIFNLTNEENFSPVFDGGYFGATLVMPEQPINAMLTLRYWFGETP